MLFRSPVVSSAWVRWGHRSRARLAAMSAVVYFIYDVLERLGVFDSLQSSYQNSLDAYVRVRALVAESYESVADGLQVLEDVYTIIKSYIDPQRLVSYLFSAGVLWWALREIKDEAPSRSSSPGGSPASTPSSTPPASPRTEVVDAGMRALSEGFLKQQEILERLAAAQERLESRLAEVAQDRRADALFREAQDPPSDPPPSILQEIKDRLESFETVIRKDRLPVDSITGQAASDTLKTEPLASVVAVASSGAGVGVVSSSPPHASPLAQSQSAHASPPSAQLQSAHSRPSQQSDLAAAINRLKRSTETP